VKLFLNYPGFLKYLQDRNTETIKECKEWKFTIIERILKTNQQEKQLDTKDVSKLKSFLLEGPFSVNMESKAIIKDETDQ
jgi:26S proteasome non-ATPase regulatory subunit 5